MTSSFQKESIVIQPLIREFAEVYPKCAAREQAEKKKTKAFGFAATINPFNRPTESNVVLKKSENGDEGIKRLEPFWVISVERHVNYTCKQTYELKITNEYAQSVEIIENTPVNESKRYEVTKSKIAVNVLENCFRMSEFSLIVDGMDRASVRSEQLEYYLKRYKLNNDEAISDEVLAISIEPIITKDEIIQRAISELYQGMELKNLDAIQEDRINILKFQLYLRPVFAFEFVWTDKNNEEKVGVIEVDGLTGEVIENGTWFTNKLDLKNILTKDVLIEVSAEISGAIIPGAGSIVRVVAKNTMPS